MTYIKVNGTLYPASIDGRIQDGEWDGRETKSITLSGMTHDEAVALLPDNTPWSIVHEESFPLPDGTNHTETNEYDNSDFCLSGDITDHRDGTVTIKMGKLTEAEEAYEILLGGEA